MTDLTLDIATSATGQDAKQEAFDVATEQGIEKVVQDLLGADRTAKLWPTLKPKLVKNSSRFVVFIKGGAPQEVQGATHVQVSLRISPDNLETYLREQGLMVSGGVKILPLVEFVDEHGTRFAWWADGGSPEKQGSLSEMFKLFSTGLAAKFKTKNIFVFDPRPASFRMSVPANYRSVNLRREDQMLFAQYMKADIVVSGRLELAHENGELKLKYDLQLWQTKSGRGIGEIQKTEPLVSEAPRVVASTLEQADRKVFTELATGLGEVLASGELNMNTLKLSLNGRLTYMQQANLRRQLEQLREIHSLKERLFEPSHAVFEAESSLAAADLAKVLQHAKFTGFSARVGEVQDDSLALDVRATSSSAQ